MTRFVLCLKYVFCIYFLLCFSGLVSAEEPFFTFQDDLSEASLVTAINQSLKFTKQHPKGAVVFDNKNISRKDIRRSLRNIRKHLITYGLTPEFYQYLRDNYKLHDISGNFKLTGYFEASLQASLQPDETYKYPIYKIPPELKQYKALGNPFYTREKIDYEGALANRGLELAWTDDPIKLFFLHVQGSGKLTLPNKSLIEIQYADNNGHTYRSIAQKLLQEKAIRSGKISMQAISEYLHSNPSRIRPVLSQNPRYIFFKQVTRGPIGCLDVTLTPKRSVALDQLYFPKGALMVLQSAEPQFNHCGDVVRWQPFTRFVLNQDTGSAIKGKQRADYFIGHGAESELIAGAMYHDARMYVILPKLNN